MTRVFQGMTLQGDTMVSIPFGSSKNDVRPQITEDSDGEFFLHADLKKAVNSPDPQLGKKLFYFSLFYNYFIK